MTGRRLELADAPKVARVAVEHVASMVSGAHRRTVGALALVIDPEGRILLARAGYPPRIWNLPGGRLERHERPDEAVIRELREETGLEVTVERLLAVDVRWRGRVTFIFACRVLGGELRLAPGEIRALRWFTLEELDRLRPRVRHTIEAALSTHDGPGYLR